MNPVKFIYLSNAYRDPVHLAPYVAPAAPVVQARPWVPADGILPRAVGVPVRRHSLTSQLLYDTEQDALRAQLSDFTLQKS